MTKTVSRRSETQIIDVFFMEIIFGNLFPKIFIIIAWQTQHCYKSQRIGSGRPTNIIISKKMTHVIRSCSALILLIVLIFLYFEPSMETRFNYPDGVSRFQNILPLSGLHTNICSDTAKEILFKFFYS